VSLMKKSRRASTSSRKRIGPARVSFGRGNSGPTAAQRAQQERLRRRALAEQEQRQRQNQASLRDQIASSVETQPIPVKTSNIISNSSFRNTNLDTVISSIESPVFDDTPPFDNTTHPPEFIDGISIDASDSLSRESARSDVISISQNSTDDDTKRKIIKSISGDPPEIISSVRLPFFEFTPEDIDDCIEVSQFERQLLKETLLKGVASIAGKDPEGKFTAAKKDAKNRLIETQKKIDAISEMLVAANSASTGLNILKMSPQIMQRTADSLRSLLYATETSKKTNAESLPSSLDEYIRVTFPGAVSIDEMLTNTSRLILLMQDMLTSALSIHPTLLSQVSRSQETKSLFSVAENFSYDLDGVPQESDKIPTVDKVFSRSNSSTVRAFIDKRVAIRPVTGLLNEGRYKDASVQWDIITHLITSVSNEMILSAGIGRLNGSQLGNKFLQLSSYNSNQYAPFDRVFGESPAASADVVSKFFQTGLGRSSAFQSSFLDYMALGEETSDRSFIVMPFEVDTVLDDSRIPYASGKKYFIDLAIQEVDTPAGTQPKKAALKTFSSQYQSFTNEVSSYLTEIMSLGVDTKLSPQVLFARVLQDFREIVRSMSSASKRGIGGNQSAIKSLTAASLFASLGSGYQPVEINTDSGSTSDSSSGRESGFSYIGPVRVSSRDVLKMSVVKAYRELLEIAPDEKATLDSKSLSILTSNELPELSSTRPESGLDITSVFIESIINNNLSIAWRTMSDPSLGGSAIIDNNGAARYVASRTGEQLYDSEFDVKDNIVNLIAKTVREIQKEAYNLSTRDGSNSDYRNSRGNTMMSDCNIDRLIDVVCEIYIRLSPMLLPFIFSPIKEDELRTTLRGNPGFTCEIDPERSSKAEKILDLLVYKISKGENVTVNDLERLSDVSRSDTIGISISPTKAGSFYFIPGSLLSPASDKILNISEIISRTNRLPNHRYYIKSSLKVLESVSQCVSSASSRISRVFDILLGNLKDNLSDSEKTLYDMFVTNISTYRNLLSSIDTYQANLCAASKYTQTSSDPVFLRRDIDTSRSERLAVRDYIRSLADIDTSYDSGGGDIHLISVGIPAGAISAITSTSFGLNSPIGTSFQLGRAGTESQNRSPLLSIDILRNDQSRVSLDSSDLIELRGDAEEKTRVYDPEIFVLPDSIAYDPSTLEPNSDPVANSPGSILEKILISTKFYRIVSGKVSETIQGSRDLPPQFRNSLVSYLLDLYMYETLRIRYNDGLGSIQKLSLSPPGFLLLNEISRSPDLSLLVMNRQGFSNLIDPITLEMKRDESLLEMITKTNLFSNPQFTLDNYKMASLLTCINIMSDTNYILSPKTYDRIYHFIYNEKTLQNSITNIEERNRRKKIDIFTLSTVLRHIG